MAQRLNHNSLPILSIGALGGTVSMRATQPDKDAIWIYYSMASVRW